MAGISSFFVLLAVLVLAVFAVFTVQTFSLRTALVIAESKLRGDISSFEYMVAHYYGNLRLVDGHLVDERGESIHYRYEVTDRIASNLGVVSTIFVRDGDDFRRISTCIIDEQGNRVVNTLLARDGEAYAAIRAGRSFLGPASILGRYYEAAYQPIFEPGTRDVIGISFIGIEMETLQDIIRKNSAHVIGQIAIIAGIILLLAILLNSLSAKFMLVKPIKSAVDMLKEISEGEGDLTRQLKSPSNDEIGDMAHYFNMTLEKIKNLIVIIKKEAGALSQIGDDLASNMTETAAANNEITANIQSITGKIINQSASVTETNATMEQVSGNINKLNEHVESQTLSVSQSSSAIEEMLANIQSVTQTLIKNADNVQDLLKASEMGRTGLSEVAIDIKEIAKESEGLLEINAVMKNIASQTNLLSMNAAIEAAHAGEAGRGFAVVAEEIRKLAESAGEQSKTISIVLKKMKTSIDKITNSTENVLTRFEAIDSSVKIVAEQEDNIRNAMEEQGEGSKQLLESVSMLNEITRQVSSGSNEMLQGAREVIQESKNLEQVTQEITGGMNEMAAGASQMNVAINHVNEISGKNLEKINILAKEVSKFKVD
ncbi:MAG: methyl-accepting chemotaxis protein [Spirochaetes bacterium]|nr:methyl-accepting chemotaxis protein [Spirochaetota bacterium]